MPFENPPPSLPPPSTPSTLRPDEEKMWGMLSHLLSFVAAYVALGFIAPLIVYFVFGPKSAFVKRHAIESLNFQLTGLVAAAAAVTLSVVTLGIAAVAIVPLAAPFGIYYVVMVILGSIRANHGEEFRYPVSIRFLRNL